jgi:hypothetical protein
MPVLGPIAKRIAFNRRAAMRLHRVSLRRHLRAAVLGRLALAAKARGHHLRARRLMRLALAMKAAAVRARMRARMHRRRIVRLRAIRRLRARRRAAR